MLRHPASHRLFRAVPTMHTKMYALPNVARSPWRLEAVEQAELQLARADAVVGEIHARDLSEC
jgi:hypothetical protein